MSGRWDTYLGHDRPLPTGEQSNREYHSGDPEPEGHCADCGCALYEGDYYTHGDEVTTTCHDCTAHPGEPRLRDDTMEDRMTGEEWEMHA